MRKTIKKIMALLTIMSMLALLPITSVKVKAANTKVMTTVKECSIWSAPNTSEQNRVKKVPAGYSITVIPEVVQSTKGDGKTFYKTAKGSYVLCNCLADTPVVTVDPIEIVAEFTLPDSINWYTRHFMVVKNNTSTTKEIRSGSYAYDIYGNVLGYKEAKVYALAPGATTVMYEAFDVGSNRIALYNTTISYSEVKRKNAYNNELTYQMTAINRGILVTASNIGTHQMDYVEGYALFFKNGVIVDFEHAFFNSSNGLRAGQSASKEFKTYDDYDIVLFYLDTVTYN